MKRKVGIEGENSVRHFFFFFFQAEGGIRDSVASSGLGDVYMGQVIVKMTSEIIFLEIRTIKKDCT